MDDFEVTVDNGLVSVEDYLAMEERSEVRHEYVGGMLYAMTGGTRKHARIGLNIAARLLTMARDTPCEVSGFDARLNIGEIWYYPDAMVVCDPEDDDPRWATKPCLLVEVLSPSNQSTDHREKLLAYRSLPSVQAYLIVHQDRQRVERHFVEDAPNGGQRWARVDHVGGNSTIPIPCPEGRLTLAEIYESV